MEINERNQSNRPIWLLTVAMLSSIYILSTVSWGRYVFLGIAVLILLLHAARNGGKIQLSVEPFFLFCLAFALFCLFTALWAWVPSAAVEKFLTLIQITGCYSCLFLYYKTERSVDALLRAVMWSGYIVSIYAIFYYGLDTLIRSTANDNLRISNTFNNINTIGMLVAYACVIQVYLLINSGFSLSSLFMLPALVALAGTQSRKALILLLLGVFLLVMIRNFHNKRFLRAVLHGVLILVAFAALIFLLLQTGLFQGLLERMESLLRSYLGVGKLDIRTVMRRVGWAQFVKTPFLGIGIGSSGRLLAQAIRLNTYLHCNYVELLACGGIVGFLLYYSIYAYLFTNIVIRGDRSDPETLICTVLLLLNLVMDYGAVSYSGKTQYFFFMIYFLHVKHLKAARRQEGVAV